MIVNDTQRSWSLVVIFAACMGVVLYGIFRHEPPPQIFYQSDKAGHVFAFLALCISGRLAFPKINPLSFWLFFLALALLLEGLQQNLRPLRSFSYEDIAANFLGVGLAMAVLRTVRRGE